MKIAIDAMGGDFAPKVVVEGTKAALEQHQEIETIYLVGDEAQVKPLVDEYQLPADRIELVHASQVVEMHESGVKALRQKKDSSIVRAVELVKKGTADAVVGAGNTGAAVATATIKLRLIKGVERAGIASPLPNDHGPLNLMDAGANPEAKPSHLLQYAVMGAVFSKYVFNSPAPVVGLMSNGEEDEKGTAFTKETFALLKAFEATGEMPFEFAGNIEGHDLFKTKLDVALCDGFVGNIILKSCEATAKAMSTLLKSELKASPVRMAGAFMAQGAFKRLKERMSYESYGGSPLLGVNGVVIIAHGSSSTLAIKNAIRVAAETVTHEVNPKIEKAIAAMPDLLTDSND